MIEIASEWADADDDAQDTNDTVVARRQKNYKN
jgi:hypothetical protein